MPLLPVMQSEPLLWGRRPRAFALTVATLAGLWLVITLGSILFRSHNMTAAIFSAIAMVGFPAGTVIYRWFRLAWDLVKRKAIGFSQFMEEVSSMAPVQEEVARATREAIGKSYRLRPEHVYSGDTERSLRPHYGASLVFAFEIAAGVPLLMGKDYLIEDPRVDDLVLRLSTEPRTVADIVRIVSDAYGGQLQPGGSIGSPISDNARQLEGGT